MKHPRPTPPRRWVNRGRWLGLFAVLMLFIGPLASQSMPMDPVQRMANMSMATHGHGCDGDAGKDQPPNGLHPLWERCGYCSLFFHCPALPQALSFTG
ncbi:DUF2946 domain-containing protein, partial [Pseudomonas typographi]|uniref:DUF2946 domain-containing protein n=1 Tax=Pseudomonas typographi TaxID=2715964 RepID=UPI0016840EC8